MKALMTIIVCLFIGSLQAQDLLLEKASYHQPQSMKAIAIDYEYLADENNSMDLYYTAACYWALAGNNQNAFRCLFYLAKNGFCELEWIEKEKDLEKLRTTPTWRLVILKVKSNIKERDAAIEEMKAAPRAEQPDPKEILNSAVGDIGPADPNDKN